MMKKRAHGLHLGNWINELTSGLREDIQRTRPSLILFMDNVRPSLVKKALQIKGDMELVYRPYYNPAGQGSAGSVANYANTARERTAGYLTEPLARQAYEAGKFLIKPFNETNIGFEGFSRGRDGFAKSLDAWHRFVNEYRPHFPKVRIGSIAPTLGNHDAWFTGDDIGSYFFHGVEGCTDSLTPALIQAAIQNCPMRSMFETADAIFYHSYGNVAVAVNGAAQRWYSRRWEQYQLFLTPYDKPHYILECDMGYDEVGAVALSATNDERLKLGHGRTHSVAPWEATEAPPVEKEEPLAEARSNSAQHNRAELFVWWNREVVDKNPKIKATALWWGCAYGEGDPTWEKHFTRDSAGARPIVAALENYHGVEQEEEEEPNMSDQLAAMLKARFGTDFEDLRGKLTTHPTNKYARRSLSQIAGYALHHTGSGTSRSTTWEQVAVYHVDSHGWPGPAYTIGIRQEGGRVKVSLINDLEAITYHVGDANPSQLALCVMGNFVEVLPTSEEVNTLRAAVAVTDDFLKRKPDIRPHSYFRNTTCPAKWTEIIPTLRIVTPPYDPAYEADKARWNSEEAIRRIEAGKPQEARALLLAEVSPRLLKLENHLKGK